MKILIKKNVGCAYMDPSVPARRFKKDEVVDGSSLEDRMLKTILREKYGVVMDDPKPKKAEEKVEAPKEKAEPIIKKKAKKKKGIDE